MAINKNFVIKNGIEVNENLLVANPTTDRVGVGTALPDYQLHVIGGIGVTNARVTGVTTASGDFLVGVDGTALAVKVSAGNSVGIGTDLPLYPLHVRGPASSGSIAGYVYGDLEVTGDFNSANFSSGSASFSGITTFTNTTNNTLNDATTGAVQIRGGLGVSRNTTIGADLYVAGNSYFVGLVTFAAGAAGKIQLGDNANDNVEFQADVDSNIIPNVAGYDLGSSSQKWRELHLAGNAGIGSLAVTGISTFNSDVDINADVDITGNIGVGSLAVSGISTFVGLSTFNGGIAVLAGVSTFLGDINADGNLDVDGRTDLDDLVVTGVSTYSADLDINADVDISGNAGVGSLDVLGISTFVGLSTFNNGIVVVSGVSTFNDGQIVSGVSTYSADLDINADVDVSGNIGVGSLSVAGISTFGSDLDINADVDVSGNIGVGSLSVAGISTFGSDIDINADIDISGNADIGSLNVSGISTFVGLSTFNGGIAVLAGVSTFLGDINADGNLDVDGQTELDDLNVAGVSTFVGVSSFTNTTNNTLGDVDTGAIKVDGGMGIAGNVTVGGGLSVTGNSYFVGMVTFAAGTNGNIQLGDTNTDNVIFTADVNSNITPNLNATYDLGSDAQQWRNFFAAGNAGIGSLSVAGVSTFSGDISIGTGATVGFGSTAYFKDNAKAVFGDGKDLEIYHDGSHSYIDETGTGNLKLRTNNFKISNNDETKTSIIATPPEGVELYYDGTKRFATSGVGVTVYDHLRVEGSSYFVGIVTFAAGTNGTIQLGDSANDNVEFQADVNSNIIPNTNAAYDLGSDTQQWRNFFAAGNAGIGSLSVAGVSTFVGVATFQAGIVVAGVTTYSGDVDVDGNLDVDGRTDLDDLVVAGVSTFSADLDVNAGANISGITSTNTLHVGTAGTVLSVSADDSTFAIGSASNPVTATMNGGAIPSIGLVIALGS